LSLGRGGSYHEIIISLLLGGEEKVEGERELLP